MTDGKENGVVNTRRARGDAGGVPPEDWVNTEPPPAGPVPAAEAPPPADDPQTKAGTPWIKITAVSLAAALLVAAAGIHYRATTPPPPREAAEDYMEQAYDRIAEEVGRILAGGFPLADELTGEFIEAAASRTLPYQCSTDRRWQTNGAECLVRLQITRPLTIRLELPVTVALEEAHGPYGQKGARATGANVQRDRIHLEAPGLEGAVNLDQLTGRTKASWQEALQGLQQLDPRELDRWFPGQ